ncbi:ubiquitin carboxyl-terminal hydrolase 43 isoform X1 [Anas platyrhynchos]|uniref:ubiquitin carboxyl-terminal hydrolase 43 isoform X1 n=1 Tax=Anas platyrhynchos TaxID=8839 RepID=UPI003AF30B85
MSAAWGGPGGRWRGGGGRRRGARRRPGGARGCRGSRGALRSLGGLAGRLLRAWGRLAGGRGAQRGEPEDDEGGFGGGGGRGRRAPASGPGSGSGRGSGPGGGGTGMGTGTGTGTGMEAGTRVGTAMGTGLGTVSRPPGAQGLRNHGNTCFMNAVVQCLSNTAPLAEFLALGRYRARGARAEVTQRLAALVRALWTLDYSPRLSAEFKSIVSKHSAQFRGNAQHDALEFLLWLLDRMHEDLGTASPAQGPCATAEPVPEQSSSAGGAAAPRAQSFVQSHFQAQYRSSLTCPHCLKQSNTFDPFLCVSLPIPTRQTRALNVTLVLQRDAGRPLRVGLAVPLRGTVAELRAMVAREGDVPPEQVILAEVSPRGSLRSLGDNEELGTAGEGAALYALQEPPAPPAGRPPAPPMLLLLLCHTAGSGPQQARFGPPLVLWQERGAAWAQLQRRLLAPLRPLMRSGAQGSGTLFRLRVAGDAAPGTYLSPQDARPLCHPAIDRALRLSGAGGPPHVQLTAEWDVATKERLFGSLQEEAVQDAESVRLQQQAHQQHSCTLDECFQLYTKEEQLAPDDAWRCPHCRVPQQGTVKLSLWTLPDILIIHLKRFRQVAEHRHKLTTLVRFPLRGLDMAPHLAPGGGRWAPRRLPESRPRDSLYDLYAVCNHHGSMQGGHYTAYCCNSLDGRWYSYDDSTVEAVQEDEVSTRSAYILFYQRRDAIPAWSASSAARGSTSSPLSDHWVARLGGSKRDSAVSQPPAPRPSPPSTPDTSTAQEKGGFEARPSVRGIQSRSLSMKLPPARRDGPPRPVPLRWSFTSRPWAPGQLVVHLEPGHRPRRPHRAVLPAGAGEDGSPHAAPQAQSPSLGEAAGTPKKSELPLCTPTLRRARSAGAEVAPRLHPKSKIPPGSGELEQRPPRGRQEGKAGGAALCSSPGSPEPPIRRSQSSASLPPRPLRLLRRSASLGRGAGGPPQPPPGPPGVRGAVLRGRERTASLRHAAVPESSF